MRPDEAKPARREGWRPEATVWGVSLPWNLIAVTLLGVWLMASPAIFQTRDRAADSDHLLGALVVTVAFISLAEAARTVRLVNVLLGAAVIVAPWLLAGTTPAATWNDVIVGAAVLLLSLPRGPVTNSYGSWDRFIV